MSKKCTPLWREAHVEVKMYKAHHVRTTFEGSDVIFSGRCKGFCTLPKVSKTWGFSSITAGVGHLQRIWKDAFRVAGAAHETCSSEMLGGQGADFLREVAFWSIRSSVLGRWFCVTGAALCMTWHHFFVAGAILQRHGLQKSQNELVRGRQLRTQLSIFEGSLAELFRFCCCQLRNLRKSRRIASFLMLPRSKLEEVSQKCFDFKLAQIDRLIDRSIFKLADRQIDRWMEIDR